MSDGECGHVWRMGVGLDGFDIEMCEKCGRTTLAIIADLRAQLSAACRERDEYRTEWQNACDRLKSSDHVIREMQEHTRNAVAMYEAGAEAMQKLARERDEAREALHRAHVALEELTEGPPEWWGEWMQRNQRAVEEASAALAASAGDK